MGDAKDQVREQAQNLILKLMCEAAPPMVWLLNEDSDGGFQWAYELVYELWTCHNVMVTVNGVNVKDTLNRLTLIYCSAKNKNLGTMWFFIFCTS